MQVMLRKGVSTLQVHDASSVSSAARTARITVTCCRRKRRSKHLGIPRGALRSVAGHRLLRRLPIWVLRSLLLLLRCLLQLLQQQQHLLHVCLVLKLLLLLHQLLLHQLLLHQLLLRTNQGLLHHGLSPGTLLHDIPLHLKNQVLHPWIYHSGLNLTARCHLSH